ncbi:unnamed protein product [Alopecurus aequalis]
MPPRRQGRANARPTVVKPAIVPRPCPLRKRKRDPYFPYVPPAVSVVYRKRRKIIVALLRSKFAEHTVRSLPEDWKGFTSAFAESLKVLYTVEFQKRGLPHAHILVWLKEDPKMVIISSLDKVVKGGKGSSVSVYVSRLWHHRGGSDTGEIKHTDMVLLDSEGNHMYAEIWKDSVPSFIHKIHEGHAYIISNYHVCDPKYNFRPVEAQLMIKFTRYTTVQEQADPNAEFPFCTYALTPLSHLPDPTDFPERFTDVLGQITGVSDPISYHTASRSDPSIKRTIHIKDLAGHQISVVLWGERATAFDGDGVIDMSKEEPVIALFVGTLVKAYDGCRGVSGSAACRWYINDDIPDVLEFKKRLHDSFSPIERIVLPGQTVAQVKAQMELETKTVAELMEMNPYDHQDSRFFVCVTLTRLSPAQRWWFTSCNLCHKTTVPYGTAYRCLNSNCKGKDAVPRYRICYMATDDEKEAEFVFFDRVGRDIVGKPLISLLRSGRSSHLSVDEVVHSARGENSVPRELAALIAKKFRFVVSFSSKSYLPVIGVIVHGSQNRLTFGK